MPTHVASQPFRCCCLSVMLCVLLPGCGGGDEYAPEVVPVSGMVTFSGQPVAAGQIHFADETRGFSFPATVTDGNFSVSCQFGDGLPPGSWNVRVAPLPPPPVADNAGAAAAAAAPPATADDIPEQYQSFATSGLTAEIAAGMSPLEFELKPGE